MINSSLIESSTPQKEFIFNDSVTPTKVDLKKRICPSGEIMQKLFQMSRVHEFLRHEELKFVDLRKLDVTVTIADKLSIALQGHIDIPDAIQRMEVKGVECGYFSEFLSNYVSEEFSIEKDYSFTAVAVLHYMNFKKTSIEEAVTELLKYSSSKSICKMCCADGKTDSEKEQIVRIHNHQILKTLLSENSDSDDSEEDISGSDDSRGDPLYTGNTHSESSSSEDSIDMLVKSSVGNLEYFNPFVSSEEDEHENKSKKEKFKPAFNSTIVSNPLDKDNKSSDPGHGAGPSSSSTSSQRKRTEIKCEHCNVQFSNRNNMKQHLISVHRIFPPGMSVYSCSSCSFNTGNRVAYQRHLQTHSKAVVSYTCLSAFSFFL